MHLGSPATAGGITNMQLLVGTSVSTLPMCWLTACRRFPGNSPTTRLGGSTNQKQQLPATTTIETTRTTTATTTNTYRKGQLPTTDRGSFLWFHANEQDSIQLRTTN